MHLFAPPAQLNDATHQYLASLSAVLDELGHQLVHTPDLAAIPHRADVLTIECKSAARISLRRPQARLWQWLQGLYPEEARWQFDSPLREFAWNRVEGWALQRSRGALMVSQAMQQHFAAKYPRLQLDSVVMPCVNATPVPDAFRSPGKYRRPAFVYAGGLQRWQCMAATLTAFAAVHRLLPEATLTLLTADQEQAAALVQSLGTPSTRIAYVPVADLPQALAAFKYGFVLREDHVVNRVATPTKVSSYMAAGVIPVMTRAAQDFAQRLEPTSPIVWLDNLDAAHIRQRVLALEALPLDAESVLAAYRAAFDRYLDPAGYRPALRDFFSRTGMGAA
ncbi:MULTISPECIES: hypothetical protein [unclassified Roseateles]|uniref:hypothetical protein n=1 Tax=unclassified Roseateles TaxID=2626991 RepID=UPI0006F8AA35|nr:MULTISPECIES: hypothetical protein [unclassified Roseateles]KQW42082.1 hypothetical protein ASC81_22540 [Pelomonas sp. Root405]KRA67685.1 hypothetical protein ASD88_24125 [Pelomonas sp. Root662]